NDNTIDIELLYRGALIDSPMCAVVGYFTSGDSYSYRINTRFARYEPYLVFLKKWLITGGANRKMVTTVTPPVTITTKRSDISTAMQPPALWAALKVDYHGTDSDPSESILNSIYMFATVYTTGAVNFAIVDRMSSIDHIRDNIFERTNIASVMDTFMKYVSDAHSIKMFNNTIPILDTATINYDIINDNPHNRPVAIMENEYHFLFPVSNITNIVPRIDLHFTAFYETDTSIGLVRTATIQYDNSVLEILAVQTAIEELKAMNHGKAQALVYTRPFLEFFQRQYGKKPPPPNEVTTKTPPTNIRGIYRITTLSGQTAVKIVSRNEPDYGLRSADIKLLAVVLADEEFNLQKYSSDPARKYMDPIAASLVWPTEKQLTRDVDKPAKKRLVKKPANDRGGISSGDEYEDVSNADIDVGLSEVDEDSSDGMDGIEIDELSSDADDLTSDDDGVADEVDNGDRYDDGVEDRFVAISQSRAADDTDMGTGVSKYMTTHTSLTYRLADKSIFGNSWNNAAGSTAAYYKNCKLKNGEAPILLMDNEFAAHTERNPAIGSVLVGSNHSRSQFRSTCGMYWCPLSRKLYTMSQWSGMGKKCEDFYGKKQQHVQNSGSKAPTYISDANHRLAGLIDQDTKAHSYKLPCCRSTKQTSGDHGISRVAKPIYIVPDNAFVSVKSDVLVALGKSVHEVGSYTREPQSRGFSMFIHNVMSIILRLTASGIKQADELHLNQSKWTPTPEQSHDRLARLVYGNMTPEDFVSLENGEIYSRFALRPPRPITRIDSMVYDRNNFTHPIDRSTIPTNASTPSVVFINFNRFTPSKMVVEDKVNTWFAKSPSFTKLSMVDKTVVFRAFVEYVIYLGDATIFKPHTELMDLFSPRRRWLNNRMFNIVVVTHTHLEGSDNDGNTTEFDSHFYTNMTAGRPVFDTSIRKVLLQTHSGHIYYNTVVKMAQNSTIASQNTVAIDKWLLDITPAAAKMIETDIFYADKYATNAVNNMLKIQSFIESSNKLNIILVDALYRPTGITYTCPSNERTNKVTVLSGDKHFGTLADVHRMFGDRTVHIMKLENHYHMIPVADILLKHEQALRYTDVDDKDKGKGLYPAHPGLDINILARDVVMSNYIRSINNTMYQRITRAYAQYMD
ncbi:MAG: hypothetical protein KAG66_03170, partial [Methylococcales bacterium]|nr:hypothetical protein [Methylococcales bacterium]